MLQKFTAIILGAILALAVIPAQAATICTLVAEPQTRTVLLAEGDCQSRATPASTFKIALAVMGFEAGFLQSAHAPVLPFRQGYPDWIDTWKQDTDPTMWIRHSNVWYSQRITEALGAERLAAYARSFGYGNADFSGDPGYDNGLERAWISSSLQVSPLEQAGFLAALIEGQLPVSGATMTKALGLVETAGSVEGWTIRGKTGSAYPRNADRSFDYARGWGWYVGWADKDGQRLVFARLVQDEARHAISGGLRARDAVLAEWPDILRRAGL
jgi:beta-lactamase class D